MMTVNERKIFSFQNTLIISNLATVTIAIVMVLNFTTDVFVDSDNISIINVFVEDIPEGIDTKELSPEVSARINEALERIEVEKGKNNYQGVISAYDVILLEDPENYHYLTVQGNNYFKEQDYLSAIYYYGASLDIVPNNVVAYTNMALAHSILGNHEAVKDTYNRLFIVDNNYLPAISNAANYYANQNDYNLAEHYFSRGLGIDSEYIPLLNNYALYNVLIGNEIKSTEIATKLSELNVGNNIDIQRNVDWVLTSIKFGNIKTFDDISVSLEEKNTEISNIIVIIQDQRIENFLKSTDVNNEYADKQNLLELSAGLLSHGQYDIAEFFYQYTVDLYPNDPTTHNGLANVFYETKRIELALEQYQETLLLEENHIFALVGSGNSHLELGNFTEAERYYNLALEQEHPAKLNAIIGLGNLEMMKNNYDDAINYYNLVIEIEPNNINALKALGNVHIKLFEIEKAKSYFKQTLNIRPNDSSAAYAMWSIYSDEENEEEALKYKKLSQLNDQQIIDQLLLDADSYIKNGDEAIANILLKRASSLDPDNELIIEKIEMLE